MLRADFFFLSYSCNRFCDVGYIFSVEAGDANAAVGHAVDAVLLTQCEHLFGVEACEREHARLTDGEGEVGADGLARGDQALAHGADTGAHAGHLILPDGVELFVVEDFVDDSGAVRGRVGVFGADDGLVMEVTTAASPALGVTICRPPARSP